MFNPDNSSFDDTGNLVEEEISFWRGFIEWWEAKEGRPATQRMRGALAYAEAKRGLLGCPAPAEGSPPPLSPWKH